MRHCQPPDRFKRRPAQPQVSLIRRADLARRQAVSRIQYEHGQPVIEQVVVGQFEFRTATGRELYIYGIRGETLINVVTARVGLAMDACRRYLREVRDGDIRAALHDHLTGIHSVEADTRYIDELGLCGTVRVDVAVVNGTFSGYELKSDRDTLRRLPTQVAVYSRVLDCATLVVGEQHHSDVRTVAMLPSWWGVMVASQTSEGVQLHEVRSVSWNQDVDAAALSQLLWRDEALEELATRGLDAGVRSKPRRVIADRLASTVPVEELRAIVRRRLKTREGWRQPAPHG